MKTPREKYMNDHEYNHLGDAYEALYECFHLIRLMTGGAMVEVNEYCRALNYPEIEHDMSV